MNSPEAEAVHPTRARLAGFAAAAIALAIYAATASRYVHPGDPSEFQAMANVGGIAHSGYESAVLMLRLFGRLPIGTMAYRANLMSCVFGAVAAGLLAFAATRWTGNPLASVVTALAFALGRSPWKESTEAGVHAFALALGVVVFLAALEFARRPTGRGAFLIGACWGFAALSHLSAFALVPVVLVTVVIAARSGALRAAHVGLAIAGLLIGLLPLAYMVSIDRPSQPMNYIEDLMRLEPAEFIRPGQVPEGSIRRVAWLLSGAQYFGYQHGPGYRPDSALRRATSLAIDVGFNDFPLFGIPLAIWGAWELWRRRRREAMLLGLWLLAIFVLTNLVSAGWIAGYFFLPGVWAMGVFIAAALGALGRTRIPAAVPVAGVVLIAAPFARLAIPDPPAFLPRVNLVTSNWSRWPQEWNPLRDDRSWDTYGRGVMKALPPRAAVLVTWGEGNVMRYFRYGEPLRPDVHVVHTGPHPGRVAHAVALELAEGRPVFATFASDARTPDSLTFVPVGHWADGGLWRVDVRKPGTGR
jgi:hypothetical protein